MIGKLFFAFALLSMQFLLALGKKGAVMTRLEKRWVKNLKPPNPTKGWYAKCQKDWKKNKLEWHKNIKKWKNRPCYSMLVTLDGYWDYVFYRGIPFKVVVRNRKIISAEPTKPLPDEPGAPEAPEKSRFKTTNEMLKDIYVKCVAGCDFPTKKQQNGAARCSVKYNRKTGAVASMYIDEAARVADEEYGYTVTSFKFCGKKT